MGDDAGRLPQESDTLVSEILESETLQSETPGEARRELRILHVFRAPVGGLFRHVEDLTRAQIARGHKVGIFCDASTGGPRGEGILASLEPLLALGLTRLPMRRNPHPSDLGALAALGRLKRSVRPDVIHSHGSKGGVYGRLSALIRRDGVVRAYTPHGGSFNHQPGTALHWLYMRVEGLLERATDIFTFESEFIADRYTAYVGRPKRPARVIWNGLHPQEFEPVVPGPKATDLVYIGEFRAAKGLPTLISALALLRERGHAASITLVGAGPDEQELRSGLTQQGLIGNATILPPQAAREAMKRGRVMVVPSRAESLPYVILEAAAARIPLIATKVGGVPEIFGPFASMLLPRDDPQALADAIECRLGASSEQLAGEAAALAAFVEKRFSVDAMADGVISAYREVVTASNRL
ncbi:Glycosyltransferase involved in cell wall bisynthesis [Rhizobiales bacterium GAS113]|nr:Glycosyltransferase involved in cell wall bisynthesis [Rhizobiales bacterium GAS113]